MLICDGGNVKAHQLILSANSEHFEQLFTNSNYPIPFIHLPNIALSDMKCLLSFMYKGTISLKMHNFTRFMETAQRLKVRGLLKTSIAPQIPTPPLDQASYFDGAANPDESASVIFENIAQDCSTEEVILSNAENARPEPDVQENIISNRSDDCNDTPGITPPPPKEAYFGGPQKASSSEQYNLNLKAWHNPHPIQGSGCQQQMFGHDYGGFVQITDRRASIAVVGQFSTARKLPTQNNQRKMSISQDRFSPYVASRMTTNENAITLRKPDVSQILGASIPPTKVQAKTAGHGWIANWTECVMLDSATN
uniref:BTB domain-containing protein n=1 Tax=Anopheles epiroticus TaxID=199890 RepID=A0A182PVU9_9DIPT